MCIYATFYAKNSGKIIRVDKIERWHPLTSASGAEGNSGSPALHIVENAMIQRQARPDTSLNKKSGSKRNQWCRCEIMAIGHSICSGSVRK